MEFEEFDESEVMFSDYSSDGSVESSDDNDGGDRMLKHCSESDDRHKPNHHREVPKRMKSHQKKPRIRSSSMPVNIPMMSSPRLGIHPFGGGNGDDEDPMSRLPPHLIVERRASEEMARSFSPFKGKNLCQVRNSILRMTGFLER